VSGPGASADPGLVVTLPRAESAPFGTSLLVAATRRIFPVLSVRLAFRGGGSTDPDGKDGLSALTARMLERGSRTRTREQIGTEIESLGASLGLSAGMESLQVGVTTLTRSLDPLMEILVEILREPSFPEDELEKLKVEMIAELGLTREEDRDLGDQFFRRAVYGDSAYGRDVEGTAASLASITRDDVVRCWDERFRAANLIAAASGDIDLERLRSLLERHLGTIPTGAVAPAPRTDARRLEGIEAFLIDKPERSQTQIFLGRTAIPTTSPDFLPFMVANHAFGGMFTGRLMQEVRVKRGWSYGASSRLEMNRGDGLMGVWTFPANGDTMGCVRLLFDLVAGFQKDGITADELSAAKGHLLNMLAFEVETPEQVVQRRVQELLLGLPDDWSERFVAGVQATTVESANAAAARVVKPGQQALTIVCTAEEFLEPLRAMPEIRTITVVPFDADDLTSGHEVFRR
jgi:zinc protease